MSDFTKEKIAFAVALLAVLFTITPIITSVGDSGFQVVGTLFLKLKYLYYSLSLALTLKVYAYSLQFLTARPLRVITAVGDIFYGVAIVAPLLYGVLFLVVQVGKGVGELLNSDKAAATISIPLSWVSGFGAAFLADRFRRLLAKKEKQSTVEKLEEQETTFLSRAEKMFSAGHYDLAVVESFKAVEIAARRNAITKGIGTPARDLVKTIQTAVPPHLANAFEHLRRTRNMAAHAVEPIAREEAQQALITASKLLAFLRPEPSSSDTTDDNRIDSA